MMNGRLLIRPFRVEDLAGLELQAMQARDLERLGEPLALIANGEAWTLFHEAEDGRRRVRMCAGLYYFSPARARAWALVGRDLGLRDWVVAARKIGARLTLLQSEHGLRRVEAETPLHFPPGHRLFIHLGFQFEAALPGVGPTGETYCQYARLSCSRKVSPRYDQCRALAYRVLIEDEIERADQRRRAA